MAGTFGSVDVAENVVAEFILCDDNGSFVRKLIQNAAGQVLGTVNLDFEGQPYTPVGDVKRCCDNIYIGEVCYLVSSILDASEYPWVADSTTTAHKTIPGYGTITAQRISGIHSFSVAATNGPCGGANQAGALAIRHATNANATSTVRFTFPQVPDPFQAKIIDLDDSNNETFISPSHGDADFIPANMQQPGGAGTVYRSIGDNAIGTFQWSGNPSATFDATFKGNCLQFDFANLTLDNHIERRRARVTEDCYGDTTYTDTETGDDIDAETIDIVDCPCCKSFILCDDNGPFMRSVAGERVYDTTLDGVTEYETVGTVDVCPASQGVENNTFMAEFVLCDDTGQFVRKFIQDETGAVTSTVNLTLAGASYTPSGTVRTCGALEILPVCFVLNANPLQVHTAYKIVRVENGATTTLYYYESDTGATHAPAAVTEVECVQDQDPLILCDDTGAFLRHITYGSYGNIVGSRDTQLDGTTPYLPVGTVVNCAADGTNVAEFVLCDDDGSFVRKFIQDETGQVIATVDLDLEGAPYVPVGTVKQCITDPVLEQCYQEPGADCTEESAERVLWQNTESWNGSNPDWNNALSAALIGGSTETFVNTQFTGITTSASVPTPAGLVRWTPGSTFLQEVIAAGASPVVRHDFATASCVVTSIRIFNPNEVTLSSDVPITVTHNTSNPAIEGSAPIVVGNGTNTVTVSSADDSRFIAVANGATFLTVEFANNTGAQDTFSYGMSLGVPSGGATYRVTTYADGSQIIVNLDDPNDMPTAVDPSWVLVPCNARRIDVEVVTLCDDDGGFLRWFLYNEEGVQVGTRDTTLDGAAYEANGEAHVCGGDDASSVSLVLTSHHKDVTGGVTWTPADVTGTLLSVTYTVLTGAANNQVVTDGVTINNLPQGFSTTWSAEDQNSLTGPTLVDGGTGGRIYVSWVEKA